jgi:hypothetical protein
VIFNPPGVPPGTFHEHTYVTLTAVPAEGYRFVMWDGQGFAHDRQDNPKRKNMVRNLHPEVYFVPIE